MVKWRGNPARWCWPGQAARRDPWPFIDLNVLWARRLLLPAATQGTVNLHQGEHLIQPRLGEIQLGVEVIGFVGQDLEVSGPAAIVAYVREVSGLPRGGGQELLLLAPLPVFLVGYQGVGNIPKRVLDGLLVLEHGLPLLCFRQPDVGLQLSRGEERLGG